MFHSVIRSVLAPSLRSSLVAGRLRGFSSLDTRFQAALSQLKSLSEPDNATKLRVYSLFKQATEGECVKPKPGALDFVGKAKWQSWKDLGSMSKDEAKEQYVSLVAELAGESPAEGSGTTTTAAGNESKCPQIDTAREGSLFRITLQNARKKNALSIDMYLELTRLLREVNNDKSVTVVSITGESDYYSAGNDLSNFQGFMAAAEGDLAKAGEEGVKILQPFVASFIDCRPLLVACVNGPAIGVACTTLALCDFVFVSERATFHTPFPSLGQSPEGCSSVTFPQTFGSARAAEILIGERKFSAKEAFEWGLATRLFPGDDAAFRTACDAELRKLSSLPPIATLDGKNLVRERSRKLLHEANRHENELLCRLWQGDECIQAVMKFMTRKSAKM